MSDNKKWYYLKFKENYFEQDQIKVLESLKPNGYIYSLIIIKLYLKSLKFEGQLKINERIPYVANNVDMLSNVIGHDPDHVMKAINSAKELGLVDILSTGEMFMSDLHSLIGHSSSEAERKALYRSKIENSLIVVDKNRTMSQNCPPEKEIELEKEINNRDRERDHILDNDFELFWTIYDKKTGKEKAIKSWSKLNKSEKSNCLSVITDYVRSTPDKQYRKDPATYLNQKSFNDEIVWKLSKAEQKSIETQKALRADF